MNISRRSFAERILNAYLEALDKGDDTTCCKIEQNFDLDGYSTKVVLIGLRALHQDKDPVEAIEEYFDLLEVNELQEYSNKLF